jgi:4-hydroxy-3-methylbut-2-enyl diphosphate reductase
MTEEKIDLSEAIPTLQERQIVQGTVVRVDSEGVLVDVGAKSEGIIPPREVAQNREAFAEVNVGDKIDVYVMRVEGEEGHIILSKRKADFLRAWERILDAYETGKIIHAMVVDRVKGGLVVDLGVRGFVPGSHVDLTQAKGRRFEWFVGQSIPLKVIEVDRAKNRVILSHKQAVEEERARRREEIFSTLQEGQVVEGVVKRITDFGAFIDLGGVDGLLPISEMSWTYIKHPSEVVRRKQKLNVYVLKVDRENGKISLGLKQILDDPWQGVETRYRVGQLVKGKVVRIAPSGVFVRLKDLDAFIPASELAERRVPKIEEFVQVGQTVEALITEIRPEERRMILSIRRAVREKERQQVKDYLKSQEHENLTIGDVAGELLRRVIEAGSPTAPSQESAPEAEGEKEPAT